MHRTLVSALAALALSLTSVLASAPPSDARTAAPTVTGLSSHAGPTAGGQRIVVNGRGFRNVRAVRFGRTKAHFTVVSTRRIKVRVPAHAAGRVDVVVTTASGRSRHVTADRYRYVAGGVRRTWRSALLPLPADADTSGQSATGTAVSCASSSLCAAIGGYRAGSSGRNLLSVYAGGHWTSTDPEPATASGMGLNGVSCAGTACVAIGSILTGGHWEGFVDRWSGGHWTLSVLPHPSAEPSLDTQWTEVSSVSCWSAGGCVVVGYYLAAKGTNDTVEPAVWRYDGTTWSASTPELPADADGIPGQYATIDHVGCSSATACVAGGTYVAGGSVVGLLERYDGTSWHASTAPVPTGATSVHVNDADCTTTGTCVVVGQYYDTFNHEQGLIEVWHAGTWTNAIAYIPPDAGVNPWVVLEGASCHGTDSCVIAGEYADTTNHHHGLVETVTGATTDMHLPARPADGDALYEELHSVSCAASCAAVGGYEDASSVIRSYVALGTTWSALAPGAAGQTSLFDDLLSVSCAPDGFCMAVGGVQVTGSSGLALTAHN